MKKKLAFLALIIAFASVLPVSSCVGVSARDYVDSWEATGNMTDEELIAIVEEVLTCEQGTIPDYAFAAMVRMQDIDPELADAAFKHMAEITPPATPPDPRSIKSIRLQEQREELERFGVYVRDGYGGHYEYYYPEDLEDEPNYEP